MNKTATTTSNELECEDILIPISENEPIRPYDKFYNQKVYRSVQYLNHDNEDVSKCSWKPYTEK